MTPRVYVGMPHRDSGTSPLAARAWAVPTARTDDEADRVQVVYTASVANSLLTMAFNTLLAQALDYRDAGHVTHLAMIHDDVEPAAGWLNTLWRQMREYDLGAVSAVIPIKNASGKTSTAIGRRDDSWRVERHVLLEERARLPETFTRFDACQAGELLLINTGLLLIDLRRPFWDGFAFGIRDRIVAVDGRRQAWTRPEDWEMSRALDAADVPYGATWAVAVNHVGSIRWPNHMEAPCESAMPATA